MQRIQIGLTQTGTECYAWALIPNHFHLLLRPRQTELSHYMRRLLSGYAVSFNRRHKRSCHLFQNRYRSILCEEETYLLELLRYIHLNPLRARLAPDLHTLDRYPWCGHAELLGTQPAIGLAAETVLQLFGKNLKAARYASQQFVADGLSMGKRPELIAGALTRSLALDPGATGSQDYDERVPGSGDFVESLRQDRLLDSPCSPQLGLSKLQDIIESHYQLPARGLAQRGRLNAVAEAAGTFLFLCCALAGSHWNGGRTPTCHWTILSYQSCTARGSEYHRESKDPSRTGNETKAIKQQRPHSLRRKQKGTKENNFFPLFLCCKEKEKLIINYLSTFTKIGFE